VRDVVDALLLAESNAQATNQVFNIAGDELATIAQIEAMIRGAAQRNALNLPPAAWFRGPASKLRDGDGLIFDLDKARAVLGFSPQVPLREGLEEMVAATLRDGQQGGAGKRADTWPGAWYD